MVQKRFGTDNEFLVKVSPDTQVAFAEQPEKAIMGDYPTLNDINAAYGKGFAAEWLIPQLDNLTLYTGAKNINERQQLELARIIANEFRYLKITEVILFFYRFKTGRYGRFYGSVDPIVITCALREFINERNIIIDHAIQEERQRKMKEDSIGTISYEEYLKRKNQNNNNM